MSVQINPYNQIAPAFWDVFDAAILNEEYREVVEEGGRGSTKSSFVSIAIVVGMLMDPLANALVYRQVGNTVGESVFEQMLWAIDLLGLTHWFKARQKPYELTYIPTGQRIMFRGADDPMKSKSIKLRKGYIKFLWFEEWTEFRGMQDIRVIKQSVKRGLDRAVTFYSYNPPKSAQNWVNAEVLVPVPGRLVHHTTYQDVPREWLGEAFFAEMEILRDTNYRAYENEYLGIVTGTGGQVFDNLEVREIADEEMEQMDRPFIGLDFGFAVDPDACVKWHYDKRTRKLYALAEYYGVRTPPEVLAEKVRAIADGHAVTCDSAEPRMIAELRRMGVNTLPAKKGTDSVRHGMRWLQDLGGIVIDPKRTPNIAREFSAYEYKQDRYGQFMAEYPDADNHAIDATRYALESIATANTVKTINRAALGL